MKTPFVQYLACYSKKNDSIYQHETILFGKIISLFLTYTISVIEICLILSKYFFENMGFLYTPSIQWPMEAYSKGSKRYIYDTEGLQLIKKYSRLGEQCCWITVTSLHQPQLI